MMNGGVSGPYRLLVWLSGECILRGCHFHGNCWSRSVYLVLGMFVCFCSERVDWAFRFADIYDLFSWCYF